MKTNMSNITMAVKIHKNILSLCITNYECYANKMYINYKLLSFLIHFLVYTCICNQKTTIYGIDVNKWTGGKNQLFS